jgi:transcriptional regulator with XRE-family HTH domain
LSTDFVARNCAALGRRLQEERKTRGYSSQESLVLDIGRSKRTITSWESGTSFPDAEDLLKLAGIGFDISYILFGMRAPPKAEQNVARYTMPAQQAAAEIAGMNLDEEEAAAIVTLARLMDKKV